MLLQHSPGGSDDPGRSLNRAPGQGLRAEVPGEAGQGPPCHFSHVPVPRKVICSLLPPGKMTKATLGSLS